MSKRRIKIIAVTALTLVSLLYGLVERNLPEGGSKEKTTARLERVADGDSLVVRMAGRSEQVRLIGIDAPELGQRPWGKRAQRHLERLLASSREIVLEYDVEKRDKYGRILAYVRDRKGRLVNVDMVKDGYAALYTVPPNVRYVVEITEAQEQARRKRAGIWGKDGLKESPSEYRRRNPRI